MASHLLHILLSIQPRHNLSRTLHSEEIYMVFDRPEIRMFGEEVAYSDNVLVNYFVRRRAVGYLDRAKTEAQVDLKSKLSGFPDFCMDSVTLEALSFETVEAMQAHLRDRPIEAGAIYEGFFDKEMALM